MSTLFLFSYKMSKQFGDFNFDCVQENTPLGELLSNSLFTHSFSQVYKSNFMLAEFVTQDNAFQKFLRVYLDVKLSKSKKSLIVQSMVASKTISFHHDGNFIAKMKATGFTKNDDLAREFLENATNLINNKDLMAAMTLINLALLFTENGKQTMEVYKERARIFTMMKLYSFAFQDLYCAIKFAEGVRSFSLGNLVYQIVDVALNAQSFLSAKNCMESYRHHLDENQIQELSARLQSPPNGWIELAEQVVLDQPAEWIDEMKDSMNFQENEDRSDLCSGLAHVSDHYKYKVSFEVTKKLDCGNVLVVDSPYACVLKAEFAQHFCHTCMRELSHFSPRHTCGNCTNVWFCSIACHETACLSFHRFECRQMHLLCEDSQIWLVFRIIVVTKLKQIYKTFVLLFPNLMSEFFDDFKDQDLADWASNAETVADSDFCNIFKLNGHENEYEFEEALCIAFSASFILKILTKIGYAKSKLKSDDSLVVKKWRQFMLTVIIKLLQVVALKKTNVYHFHEKLAVKDVTEMHIPSNFAGFNVQNMNIAVALYPRAIAHFNHSCEANVELIFGLGGACLVRNIKPLSPGDHILISYAQDVKFYRSTYNIRQELLKKR